MTLSRLVKLAHVGSLRWLGLGERANTVTDTETRQKMFTATTWMESKPKLTFHYRGHAQDTGHKKLIPPKVIPPSLLL